jgi:hypothetical protein
VEGALEGDDLGPGCALFIMVPAGHLDRQLAGLGARVGEEHRIGKGLFHQHRGEAFLLGDAVEVRDMPEPGGLFGQGCDQLGVRVAKSVDRDPGTQIKISGALHRGQPGALTAGKGQIGAVVGGKDGRDHGNIPEGRAKGCQSRRQRSTLDRGGRAPRGAMTERALTRRRVGVGAAGEGRPSGSCGPFSRDASAGEEALPRQPPWKGQGSEGQGGAGAKIVSGRPFAVPSGLTPGAVAPISPHPGRKAIPCRVSVCNVAPKGRAVRRRGRWPPGTPETGPQGAEAGKGKTHVCGHEDRWQAVQGAGG